MASAKLQDNGFGTFREIYRKPSHKISELTVVMSVTSTSQIELKSTCRAPQCTLQTHSNTWSVPRQLANGWRGGGHQPTDLYVSVITAHTALQFDLGLHVTKILE